MVFIYQNKLSISTKFNQNTTFNYRYDLEVGCLPPNKVFAMLLLIILFN